MKRKPAKRKSVPAELVPTKSGSPARIRRIQRLCVAFDFDLVAGEIIVDLLERVERLQRELENFRF